MLTIHLYIIFGECLSPLPIFQSGYLILLLLSYKNSWIFWVLLPHHIWFLHFLFSSTGWFVQFCFSHCWLCPLMYRIFWVWDQFIYCCFVACAFGVFVKKILPHLMSWIFSPVFCSRSFIVWGFRYLILFELIFVCGILRQYITFFFTCKYSVDIQFSQQHLFKRLFFSHWMFLVLLLKIIWPYDWGLFLTFLFLSLHVCLYVRTILLWLL